MKKFTYLLALLLTFCGATALAETGDVVSSLSGLSTSKIYVLTASRGTLQVVDDAVVDANATADVSNTVQQFAFVKPSDDASTYYIYSVSKKRFLGIDKSWTSVFASNGTFSIKESGNSSYPFYFVASNGNYLNIDGEKVVYINGWKTLDDGNCFSFTEAGDLSSDAQAAISTMLANYYSDAELATIRRTVTAYGNASSTDAAYTTFKGVYDDSNTDASTLKTAYSTFLSNRTNVFNTDTKVVLGNKQHTSMYMYYKTSGKKGTGHWAGSSSSIDNPYYLWTVKVQSDGTVKLYNEYANKWVGGNPGENNIEYEMVDNESDAASYTPIAKGDYVSFVDLTYSDVSLAALHMTDWTGYGITSGIVRWGNSADASYFKVLSGDNISSYLTSWTASITDKIGDEYLGDTYNTSDVLYATTDLNKATADNYVAAYKALETAISEANTVAPDEDAYYTIEVARRAAHVGQVLTEGYGDTSSSDGSNALQHVTRPANIVPALWQFVPAGAEGQYYIKAVNSGSYISKTNGTGYLLRLVGTDSDDKGTFSYGKNSVDVAHAVSLKDVNASSHTLISTRIEDARVVAWDNGNDGSGNNFKIKAVTEIPVAIGSTGYATLNLPFAVTIPDGVKAYKGTKGDGEIVLTEVSGVLAANQPVILVGSASTTYQFPIAESNSTTATASGLSGTLVPVTVESDATAYILKNGDNGIGMYKITSDSDRTIPANKAYVAVNDGAANVLVFNFGEATGIRNAAAAADGKANTYYDLNGRQVLYPAHGVFVKANGQKVYIK